MDYILNKESFNLIKIFVNTLEGRWDALFNICLEMHLSMCLHTSLTSIEGKLWNVVKMLPRPAIYSKIDNILQFLADESRSYTKADSFAFV